MNTEIFVAILAALVAYRVLSPLIDAVNPLTVLPFLSKGKDQVSAHAIQGVSGGPQAGAGRGR